MARKKMADYGYSPDIRLGKNHSLPFEDNFADYMLAAYCSYYCDEGLTIKDTLKEYSRVLKKGGYLITCILDKNVPQLEGAVQNLNGTYTVTRDLYNISTDYPMFAVSSNDEIEKEFSQYFDTFSFGRERCDYYGFGEDMHWVICRKK